MKQKERSDWKTAELKIFKRYKREKVNRKGKWKEKGKRRRLRNK